MARVTRAACLAATAVAAVAAATGCSRACAPAAPPEDAPEAAAAAFVSPPPLHVTTLTRSTLRLKRIALDATHVHFTTVLGGAYRVAKAGGEVESLGGESFPPAGVAVEARRAYYSSLVPDDGRTGVVDGAQYAVDAGGVYRTGADGGRTRLARAFPVNIERKVLLVGDTRVYWLEPAASAVLSVPRDGGPVAYVCEAWVPVHYDLALWGDRVYLLDVTGELTSAPAAGGGATTYHGSLDSELGSNRNGVWIAVEGDGMYVVSDAIGYHPGERMVIELGKPLATDTPVPKFDSRVVRVELPRGGGTPLEPHVDGLTFGTNVYIEPNGNPQESDLARMTQELEPLRALLAAGKVPLTISLGANTSASGATEAVNAVADRIEAAIHERLGAAVRVERVVRAVPPGSLRADAGPVAPTGVVGVDRRHMPVIFAP